MMKRWGAGACAAVRGCEARLEGAGPVAAQRIIIIIISSSSSSSSSSQAQPSTAKRAAFKRNKGGGLGVEGGMGLGAALVVI